MRYLTLYEARVFTNAFSTLFAVDIVCYIGKGKHQSGALLRRCRASRPNKLCSAVG